MDHKETLKPLFNRIVQEATRARKKHPPLYSTHEAYAVILEELEEWWETVKRDDPNDEELLSVATMALLAIVELGGRNKASRPLEGPGGKSPQTPIFSVQKWCQTLWKKISRKPLDG